MREFYYNNIDEFLSPSALYSWRQSTYHEETFVILDLSDVFKSTVVVDSETELKLDPHIDGADIPLIYESHATVQIIFVRKLSEALAYGKGPYHLHLKLKSTEIFSRDFQSLKL